MTTTITDANTTMPALGLIIFGLDAAGKAHASAFAPTDVERAEKAASLMGMHTMTVDDARRELAARLPKGKIFAGGKGFVPFVARPLYERLCALGGHPVGAVQPPKPRKAAATSTPPSAAIGRPPERPLHWSAIKVGSLVLATTGEAEGWYEAVTVEDKGDDLFVLRWRDWPDEALFLRRRQQLALLPIEDEPAAKADPASLHQPG